MNPDFQRALDLVDETMRNLGYFPRARAPESAQPSRTIPPERAVQTLKPGR